MTALTDWAALVAAFDSPRDRIIARKTLNQATVQGRLASSWTAAPLAGSAPTTAAVPTKATVGTFPFDAWGNSGGSLATYCLGGHGEGTATIPYMLIVADRLSHQGGLSGTTTGAQTTNLPTAALTRYTSGVGVMMALEIYSQIGNNAITVTVSYTNSAGTSGQTSPTTAFGTNDHRDNQRFMPLPLASGDVGVQAVASVTLSATSGAIGNFGVTLFKPLFAVTVSMTPETYEPVLAGNMFGGIPEIQDDACLFFLNARQTVGEFEGQFAFAEV